MRKENTKYFISFLLAICLSILLSSPALAVTTGVRELRYFGPTFIPDLNALAIWFPSDGTLPAGATVTSVDYRIRVAEEDTGETDFWCEDYIIALRSNTNQSIDFCRVWDNDGGWTDMGEDDDTPPDDWDIWLNWRTSSCFNGEDAGQMFGCYITDTLSELGAAGDGEVSYVNLDINWQADTGCVMDPKFGSEFSAHNGDTYYTDRSYTLTDLGPFSGMTMYKTPNDDRHNTLPSGYFTSQTPSDIYVYVGYDRRASSPPNWLTSNFTKIPCARIHTSLSTQGWLDVYKRHYNAGDCIDLGGNKGPGFSGGTVSNYIILVGWVDFSDQCGTSCLIDPKFVSGVSNNGVTYYTDRTYTLTDVGPFSGMSMFKTPNDDRNNTQSSGYFKLMVSGSAWIYVAYDSRASSPPSWLTSNFTKIPCARIFTSLSSQPYLEVYKKAVSDECVDLGGNKGPGFSGGTVSNYLVLLSGVEVGDQCGSSCDLDPKFGFGIANNGNTYYTDRTYTLTDVGPFSGMSMLKTPNDDRNNTMSSGYFNATVSPGPWVYVFYDSRASSPPTWLTSNFTKIPCARIFTSLSSQPYLEVYKKFFNTGECVNLGGNKGPGFSGGTVSNYVVLSSTVEVGDQCGSSCDLDPKFGQDFTPNIGDLYYTDRSYTITGEGILGILDLQDIMIKTPNDERNNTQLSGYMRFEMPFDGWVNIFFDSRLTSVPSWASGWSPIPSAWIIFTSLGTQPHMVMYERPFNAGECVDLGGNKGPGASSGTASNYIVMLNY